MDGVADRIKRGERERGRGKRPGWFSPFFLRRQAGRECTWAKRDADFLLGSPNPLPQKPWMRERDTVN